MTPVERRLDILTQDPAWHDSADITQEDVRAIECGREAIRLLDLFMQHSRIEEPELATVYSDMLALLRRCREGA